MAALFSSQKRYSESQPVMSTVRLLVTTPVDVPLLFLERRELSLGEGAVVRAERPLDLRAVRFEPGVVTAAELAVDRKPV